MLSSELLGHALDWLRELDGVPPEKARDLLTSLRARHPETPMRLLWQREAATDDHHYDLLFPTSRGTVSLSFAPDRAIPWPLRGGQRSGDHLVLRVDGVDVTWEKAVSVLDVLWEDTDLARRLVDVTVVDHVLAARDTTLPADRLQQAMDAFRRARGLLTAEAARRWMAERGLSHTRLEEIVAGEAAVADLRREMAEGRVERCFATRHTDFDRLRVVRFRYADAGHAASTAALLREGRTDPGTLAVQELLAGTATSRMETNDRASLTALFGPSTERAAAGEVLGPAPLPDGGLCVAHVLAVESAVLDEPLREFIERRIFEDWLAARRREVHLEWFWGSRVRTDALDADLSA
ncbi:TIGR04500 family putative peptide maturation system protein [Streptosporangium sp. NPDC049376]|uniref:TIGR04500 family putative peptide maturation system protein n=1 Tax=Streptosporangium sp. NPDC049376 TaxID=3366192 RepID=UPI0037A57FC9